MKFSLTQKAGLISDFHLEKLNLITSPHLINFKKRAFVHFSSYTFICFHVLIFMGGFCTKNYYRKFFPNNFRKPIFFHNFIRHTKSHHKSPHYSSNSYEYY